MMRLSLSMLGTWRATLDGEPITAFESDKVRALLAYVAVESSRPHRRESLAALLWPERPERNARQNLSQALYNLRQAIGDHRASPPFLNTTHQAIQFIGESDYWLDVTAFSDLLTMNDRHEHAHLSACDPCLERARQAIELYHGDFLAGFSLSDAVAFDEWSLLMRERLRRQMLQALDELVNAYDGRERFESALPFAWRQVELDPWNEKGQQNLIRLLARSGRKSEALAQYEKCRQLLWDELGVEPNAETQALHEAIRSGRLETARDLQVIRAKRRNQLILLEKVESFWINGFLGDSIVGNRLIKTTKQPFNRAIERPWDMLGTPGASEEEPYPPGKTMGEIFSEADRALLILGNSGSGKTNALLQLARERLDQARLDQDEPVPLVLNLASWSEGRLSVAQWVANELTARYQIPRQMGQRWLDEQELLLLLDGFDEISAPFRDACVRALNQFRVGHGLTGIAICSRTEAYVACETRLRLGGAVLLQPLTLAQIDAYLASGGRGLATLRTALRRDRVLQELAKTPLMLSLMRTIYGDQDTTTQTVAGGSAQVVKETAAAQHDPATGHRRLLRAYVQTMLRRPFRDGGLPDQIQETLAWLAQQMTRHNQSIFQLEQLQPSWLTARGERWAYLILSRLISGLLLGIQLWLLFLAMQMLAPGLRALVDVTPVVKMLGGATSFSTLLSFLLLNLALGGIVAILDVLYFDHRQKRDDESRIDVGWGRRQRAVTGLLVGLLAFLYYDPWYQPLMALGSGIMEAALFTYRSYRENGQSYRTEIGLVEALDWSWTSAARGLLYGFIVGLSVGVLGWILFEGPFAIASGLGLTLVFFLGGGMSNSKIEEKNATNLGIRLSLRNGLLAAFTVGPAVGLLAGVLWSAPFGLFMGLIFTLGSAIAYGGRQVIQHGLLRLLLFRGGYIPLYFVRFLDTAVERALLYRVGGGYMFIHRMLQDYFADLDVSTATDR